MNSKRIGFILLGIALLISLGFWLIACLFACGQLYNTYDLWFYISDAPVAVLIIIVLFAGSIASFVAAIRAKKRVTEYKDRNHIRGYRRTDKGDIH